MNDASKTTPWYRIHIITCVAVMMVGAAMLWIQAVIALEYFRRGNTVYGWPLIYRGWELPTLHSQVAFVINAATASMLLLGTGFIVEQVTRRTASRLQFSLTAALVVVTALAVMLGERYAEFNMYVLAERLELHATLLTEYPWYLFGPIYFAIFCTLCTIAWGVVALISRWFWQFDRRMT